MAPRPSFQFYPSDWITERGLRLCSISARGLWIELLCLMHEGQPYGHLTLEGVAPTIAELARLVGENASSVTRWIRELENRHVFSRTTQGVVFSRRMVRDERARQARAAGGAAGAQHGYKGAKHGSKGGRPPLTENPPPDTGKGGLFTPLRDESKPPPSSSSSSPSKKKETDATASAKKESARGSRLPAEWAPKSLPENVAALASLWPFERYQRELHQFRDYWASRAGGDAARLDWDKTWHNRIRDQHDRIMKETSHGRPRRPTANGTRPSPAWELYQQGLREEAEERAAEDQDPDRGTWPALPAVKHS